MAKRPLNKSLATDVQKLLPRFLTVCEVMANEYNRGVIYRDQKRANIGSAPTA